MPTYVHECPTHGRFDAFRPMAQSAVPATCPECGEDAPKRVALTAGQISIHGRFMVDIPVTDIKARCGGGDWENAVADYRRHDGPYAGPLPGNDRPAHLR